MSLHIDVRDITAVLLADGWHSVKPGTFRLDAYEYSDTTPEEYTTADSEPTLWSGGGVAFEFTSNEGQLAGPLSSVLATRRAPAPRGEQSDAPRYEVPVQPWCGSCGQEARQENVIHARRNPRFRTKAGKVCRQCHPACTVSPPLFPFGDRCMIDGKVQTDVEPLYAAWQDYCRENGSEWAYGPKGFVQLLGWANWACWAYPGSGARSQGIVQGICLKSSSADKARGS